MKRFILSAFVLILLGCSATQPLPPEATEDDGSIRQRLKERMERRNQKTQEINADSGIAGPGDYSFTIQHAGLERMYRVHVPENYDFAKPVPLLFALHGGGGNMNHHAEDANYGHISMSEREGFIVVFPNGFSKLRTGRFATWNAGACCGAARDENVDDIGFIRRILAEVSGQLNIDSSRIHATGMSNGAMMAYRLACEMPEVFKAVAAVAGTDNTHICTPKSPVSVLHIHAKNDSHVLFTGGAGPDARDKSVVTDFASVAGTVSKWARLNGCADKPRRILEKTGAYCELYTSCQGEAEVQLCVTESGGHSWPGATKTRGEAASQAISANEVMWEFFNRR